MVYLDQLDQSEIDRLPPHRIGDRIAEHVEEYRLEQGVELGEGLRGAWSATHPPHPESPQSASARRGGAGGFEDCPNRRSASY